MLFQQNDINPCIWTCNSTVLIFLCADHYQVWSVQVAFLGKDAWNSELEAWASERNSLLQTTNLCGRLWVAYWNGSAVHQKLAGYSGNETMQIDGHSRIEGPGKRSHKRQVGPAGTSRVPVRCWNLPVHDGTKFRHCCQYQRSHEGCSITNHRQSWRGSHVTSKDVRGVYWTFIGLPQLDDVIHVIVDADWEGDPKTLCSKRGGLLAIGPTTCFIVRHWSVT